MPTTPKTTPAERKALAASLKLAKQILALRKSGVKWDGADGIVARGLVKGAPQGRKLLRQHGLAETGQGIAPSYERTNAFRSAESERRAAKVAAAKPKARKRAAK